MWAANIIQNIFRLAGSAIEVASIRLMYNEYTIAEYLRKKGAAVGKDCEIHIRNFGEEPFLIEIGNHVMISRGAVLHTHDGGAWIATVEDPDLWLFGKIVIEDNCLIGANAQILPNVRIGKNSIIGAGSVVINNVPPDSVVMGVPARVISSSAKYRQKCADLWKEQKPPGWPFKTKKRRAQELREHLSKVLGKQEQL